MNASARIAVIEFKKEEVRVAVVKTGGKLPKVLELLSARAVFDEETDSHDAFVTATTELMDRMKSRPTLFMLCASSEFGVTRLLPMPVRGRSRQEATVRYELEPHLAIPVEDLIIDFLPVRPLDNGEEVLTVGLRRDILEGHLAVLGEAGIEIEGIGLDAVGMTALWAAVCPSTGPVSAVLHLREEGAVFAAMNGNKLAYVRHVPVSARVFHNDPRTAAREVHNVIRAYVAVEDTGPEIDCLNITGNVASTGALVAFEGELNLPVCYEDILLTLDGADVAATGDAALQADGGEIIGPNHWSACVGVATAAASGEYALDFLKEELLGGARVQRGIVKHIVTTAAAIVLIALGYLAYTYVGYRQNVSEAERLGQKVWEEVAATFPNSPETQARPANDLGGVESIQLMGQLDEAERNSGTVLSVERFTRPNLLDILKELGQTIPDDKLTINSLEIRFLAKGMATTISGDVNDMAAFTQIRDNLENSLYFRLESDPARATRGDKETFTFKTLYEE